jgi:hypothetical protein
MNIVLDRRLCNRSQIECETCFASHLAKGNFNRAECVLEIIDTGRTEFVYKIYDRDKSIKNLTVTGETFGKALDSWQKLWEEQAGPVI